MQKLERIAMKSLLDEYQLIVNERNQLLSKQKELEGEVIYFKEKKFFSLQIEILFR